MNSNYVAALAADKIVGMMYDVVYDVVLAVANGTFEVPVSFGSWQVRIERPHAPWGTNWDKFIVLAAVARDGEGWFLGNEELKMTRRGRVRVRDEYETRTDVVLSAVRRATEPYRASLRAAFVAAAERAVKRAAAECGSHYGNGRATCGELDNLTAAERLLALAKNGSPPRPYRQAPVGW